MDSSNSNKALVLIFLSFTLVMGIAFPAPAKAESLKAVAHRLGRDLAIIAVSPVAGAAFAGVGELEEDNMPAWERPVACTTGAVVGVVVGPVMAVGFTGYDMLYGARNEKRWNNAVEATRRGPRAVPSGSYPDSQSLVSGMMHVSIEAPKDDNPPQLIWQPAATSVLR